MKYAIIFFVAIVLSSAIMAGEEPKDTGLIYRLTQDTVVDGFYFEPIRINNPFSPICDIVFNLPEASIVSLFVTDTLGNDTSWFCRQEHLRPGRYGITRPDSIIALRKRSSTSGTWVYAYLQVTSTYGRDTGFPIECTFEAIRRM